MQNNVSHYKTLNRQDIFNALLYLRLYISNMQTSTVCFSFICWAPNGFLFEKIKFSVNCRSHSFLWIRNYASYTNQVTWFHYIHDILVWLNICTKNMMSINSLRQYKYFLETVWYFVKLYPCYIIRIACVSHFR